MDNYLIDIGITLIILFLCFSSYYLGYAMGRSCVTVTKPNRIESSEEEDQWLTNPDWWKHK